MAKNSPISTELDPPRIKDFVMPASGSISRDDIPEIETESEDINRRKDWAEKMAFANEKITIRLSETNDPNDEPRVPVCVNGERSHPVYGNDLPRGVDLVVKRCVAEVLLRAKPINVRTVETRDGNGDRAAKIVQSVGTKYPLEIVNSKPRDNDWMRQVRLEA